MNIDDFEQKLQRQPLRKVPGEWREEILLAARQTAAPPHTPRPAPSFLLTISRQVSGLLWPHPVAWAGLAAAWLLILGLNHATRDALPRLAKGSLPVAPRLFMAFQEQERLLNELIGPPQPPLAEPLKPAVPRPRSERRQTLLMA